jgi:hypothetical protein
MSGSAALFVDSAYAQEALTVSTTHSSGMNLTVATTQTID